MGGRGRKSLAVGLALGVCALMASGSSAEASSGNGIPPSCSGTEHITYNPGLRLFSQDIHYSGIDSYTCDNGLTLTLNFDGAAALSCANPLSAVSGTAPMQWGDGETSTWEWSTTVTNSAGVQIITTTGTIIAGKFQGREAIQVISETPPLSNLLSCLNSPGVTSQSGISTFQVV